MTFFSHRLYFICLLPVSTVSLMLCNIYDPFLAEKPLFQNKTFLRYTFFSQFVLCRASNKHYFSKYWGTDAWAVPHLYFWGGGRPSSPLKSPPMDAILHV